MLKTFPLYHTWAAPNLEFAERRAAPSPPWQWSGRSIEHAEFKSIRQFVFLFFLREIQHLHGGCARADDRDRLPPEVQGGVPLARVEDRPAEVGSALWYRNKKGILSLICGVGSSHDLGKIPSQVTFPEVCSIHTPLWTHLFEHTSGNATWEVGL